MFKMRTFTKKERETRLILVDQYNDCVVHSEVNCEGDLWFKYDVLIPIKGGLIHQTKFRHFADMITYFDKMVGPNNLHEFLEEANALQIARKI